MGVYVALLPSGVAVIRPDDMTLSVGLLFSIISLPSLCSPPIFGALISTKAGSASYANAAIFGGQWLFPHPGVSLTHLARVYSDDLFCRNTLYMAAQSTTTAGIEYHRSGNLTT